MAKQTMRDFLIENQGGLQILTKTTHYFMSKTLSLKKQIELRNGRSGPLEVFAVRAIYNFAVDGGAISTITPRLTAEIPDNAIIVGGTINSTTAATLATKTRDINSAFARLSMIAVDSSGRWQFDDTNQEDYPFVLFDLNAGTTNY